MSPIPDVVVAIPARNEAARIEDCLHSVLAAVRLAQDQGVIGSAIVAVAAHRCRDDTAGLARSVLGSAGDVASLIWETEETMPVGAVRARLIRCVFSPRAGPDPPDTAFLVARRDGEACLSSLLVQAASGSGLADARGGWRTGWLFSTDADSCVPPDWITTGLSLATAASAVLVVGLVDLDDDADLQLRAAHDQLVRVGIHGRDFHDHVYAANLAVRLDCYAAVGGFPAAVNGEEHALVAMARAAGHPVLTTTRWRVQTSARIRGRARGGLADLLGRLAQTSVDWERTA